MKILVIADDLTGAGEIAGIGWRYGLDATLYRDGSIPVHSSNENLVVIDSNTRGMSPDAAAAAVDRLISALPVRRYGLIYKKTDSVLRGPVMAELESAMHAVSVERALLIPQNPSRGRCVRDRLYTIHGVPLHQTGFTCDPVHPAGSSDIHALLGPARRSGLFHIKPGETLPPHGVTTIDADSHRSIVSMASSAMPDTLFAGGGDFFDALLSTRIGPASRSNRAWPIGSFVLVCGSLADRDNHTFERAMGLGLKIIYTPGQSVSGDSRNGSASDAVRSEIAQNLKLRRGVVVATSDHNNPDHGDRMAISSRLIDLTVDYPKDIGIDEYLVTGGFTADLLMRRLEFRTCHVSGQWADGVVRLTASEGSGPAVTIKPGSYAWPDTIWNAIAETDQGIPA
jgi:uncharacterized protein YgbK (DUF1537 family)